MTFFQATTLEAARISIGLALYRAAVRFNAEQTHTQQAEILAVVEKGLQKFDRIGIGDNPSTQALFRPENFPAGGVADFLQQRLSQQALRKPPANDLPQQTEMTSEIEDIAILVGALVLGISEDAARALPHSPKIFPTPDEITAEGIKAFLSAALADFETSVTEAPMTLSPEEVEERGVNFHGRRSLFTPLESAILADGREAVLIRGDEDEYRVMARAGDVYVDVKQPVFCRVTRIGGSDIVYIVNDGVLFKPQPGESEESAQYCSKCEEGVPARYIIVKDSERQIVEKVPDGTMVPVFGFEDVRLGTGIIYDGMAYGVDGFFWGSDPQAGWMALCPEGLNI